MCIDKTKSFLGEKSNYVNSVRTRLQTNYLVLPLRVVINVYSVHPIPSTTETRFFLFPNKQM